MIWCVAQDCLKKAAWTIAILPLCAAAQERQLSPQLFELALKTAAEYADDASLVFYCLRRDDVSEFLHLAFHADIQDGVRKLDGAGATREQKSRLVRVVLSKVRLSTPEAEDATLDKVCAAKDVAKAYSIFAGVGTPLALRPPFAQLQR